MTATTQKVARQLYFTAAALGLCLFAANLLAFYPGLVTYDGVLQYGQAISGRYVDAHPPLMALLWRYLDMFLKGPGLMLVFNLALYWLCFFNIARFNLERHAGILGMGALAGGLFPFLLSFSGVIWKDVILAACWGAACSCALLLALRDQFNLRATVSWWAAVIALIFGAAMRYNAAPAAIVLAAVLVLVAPWRAAKARIVSFLALSLVCLAIIPVSNAMLKAEPGHSLEHLISWDITGMAWFSGREPETLAGRATPIETIECYSPRLFDACPVIDLGGAKPALQTWGRAVRDEPLAYLQHRALIFAMLMRFGCEECQPFVSVAHDDANPYGFDTPDNPARKLLRMITYYLGETPLGRPFVWLVASIGLAALCWQRRKDPAMRILSLIALSGTAYAASYFPATLTDEFRYSYWLMFSTVIVLAVLLFEPPSREGLRRLGIWVALPVIAAIVVEMVFRAIWVLDTVAPSMTTNY